jgi:hypothetical protein
MCNFTVNWVAAVAPHGLPCSNRSGDAPTNNLKIELFNPMFTLSTSTRLAGL